MNKYQLRVPEHFKHFRDRFLSIEPVPEGGKKKDTHVRKEAPAAPNKHPTLKALATFSG